MSGTSAIVLPSSRMYIAVRDLEHTTRLHFGDHGLDARGVELAAVREVRPVDVVAEAATSPIPDPLVARRGHGVDIREALHPGDRRVQQRLRGGALLSGESRIVDGDDGSGGQMLMRCRRGGPDPWNGCRVLCESPSDGVDESVAVVVSCTCLARPAAQPGRARAHRTRSLPCSWSATAACRRVVCVTLLQRGRRRVIMRCRCGSRAGPVVVGLRRGRRRRTRLVHDELRVSVRGRGRASVRASPNRWPASRS